MIESTHVASSVAIRVLCWGISLIAFRYRVLTEVQAEKERESAKAYDVVLYPQPEHLRPVLRDVKLVLHKKIVYAKNTSPATFKSCNIEV